MKTLITFLLICLPGYSAGCAASWGNGYTYCRSVTINHTQVSNTDQTNFPVGVFGTFSYLATVGNGGHVQSASGFDIIFTSDQQGSTVLKFERAVWVATTGLSEFWIKVPTVSVSADTTIYLFYGKTGVVVDPADPHNTWDANYQGVWHFGDGTTLSLTDSTVNGNTATNNGGVTATTGQINGAASFASGSMQFLDAGNNASLEITTPITVEAWIKYTAAIPLGATTFPTIATNLSTGGLNGYGLILHADDGGGFSNQLYFAAINTGAEKDITSGVTAVQNTVYYIAATYDSAAPSQNAHLYITGIAPRNSAFSTNAIGASTQNITFSRLLGVPAVTSYWDGFLDELRISNTARSSDWINTGSANTTTPNTFYTIGPEVINGASGGGPKVYIFR
jgi:hypothetical protein